MEAAHASLCWLLNDYNDKRRTEFTPGHKPGAFPSWLVASKYTIKPFTSFCKCVC